jgi:hypothetical protein
LNDGEKVMRKLISINQVSLDGIMQSPGGPQEDPRGDFKLGGWIFHIGTRIWLNAWIGLFPGPSICFLGAAPMKFLPRTGRMPVTTNHRRL